MQNNKDTDINELEAELKTDGACGEGENPEATEPAEEQVVIVPDDEVVVPDEDSESDEYKKTIETRESLPEEKKYKKPKLTFRQWIENYWYHNKGKTLAGLFIASVAAFLIITSIPDSHDIDLAMFIGDSVYNAATSTALEDYIAGAIEDWDGDGEIQTEVASFYLNSSDPSISMANQVQMDMEFSSNHEYILVITDKLAFDEIVANYGENTFEQFGDYPLWIGLTGCEEVNSQILEGSCPKLGISLIRASDEMLSDEDTKLKRDNAIITLENLEKLGAFD